MFETEASWKHVAELRTLQVLDRPNMVHHLQLRCLGRKASSLRKTRTLEKAFQLAQSSGWTSLPL